jgi:putative ABC transport system permease protein
VRRIALKSLLHDRGKAGAALAGVAFATTLLLVQSGVYLGFLETSAGLISRVGGDVWVMARGTPALEFGDPLSPAARRLAQSSPCVQRARALVMTLVQFRNADGEARTLSLIGFDSRRSTNLPWSMVRGLPGDLAGPDRVTIDDLDTEQFRIHGDPMGATFEVSSQTLRVAGITHGIRSFTLSPFTFTDLGTARRLLGLGDDEAHYWVLDVPDSGCAERIIAQVNAHPELEALTTAQFRRRSEHRWVVGSGAGAALGFTALLGLVVGLVIVAQTLFTITREHLKELGTLKALGALDGEIIGFVAWQAAYLALVGGALGFVIAFVVAAAVGKFLLVLLTARLLAISALVIVLMCAVASMSSIRKVIQLEPAEVFK